MRTFWAVLIIVIAAAGFVVFSGSDNATTTPALQTSTPAPAPAADSQNTPAALESDTPAAPAEIVRDAAEELIEDAPALAETETLEADELTIVDLTAEDIAEATEEAAADEIESTAVENTATEIAEASNGEADEAVPGWDALAENAADSTESAATDEAATEEAPVNLTITETEAGALQVGDKFTITGKGTKDEPYVVPWDFLVSIRQAYSPREGRTDIPEHFAFFDGKYISIAGYLQFPLASPQPTECLVMLNQWDGCCIGVPPTPYDAIEVALSTPATQAQKFAVEGRIVGKLKIDPYLVGNWLIGLYLIGDATVDVSGSRSAEEVYGNTPSQFLPGQ